MKKVSLVTVLLYRCEIVAVCRSRSKARNLAKMLVSDACYLIDKFDFKDLPLV